MTPDEQHLANKCMYANNISASLQACLILGIMINNVSRSSGFNSGVILVNLVADKANMGRINGAAMALQSGGRAIGPILSGAMWAASVSLHIPGQQFLGFAFIGMAVIATQFLYVPIRILQQSFS